jgi:hypothetical protein
MIAMEDNKALKAELLVIRDRLDSAGVCWALFLVLLPLVMAVREMPLILMFG